jgi:hypothetical protein
MYLEFFIAGLTGLFFWLFLRHLFAFYRERICQKMGNLLEEIKLPRKGVILRIAVGLCSLFGLCVLFIVQDYMMFSFKMKLGDTIEFSPISSLPEFALLLELHFCLIIGLLLNCCSFFSRRMRLSLEIREKGLVYGFPAGILHLPWERIAYFIFSSSKKRLQLQRKGHLPIFRRRFSVEDGETVVKLLGQFVEIRDRKGMVLARPDRSSEAPQSPQAVKITRWRFFRFQFDLLSLMLLMLVVASAASWYAYRQKRSQPAKIALAALAEFQPTVVYRDVDVRYLLFWGNGKKPSDKDLFALRSFPNLEGLDFSVTPSITDAGLVEVESLSDLKMLGLMKTSITDAGLLRLKNLTRLRELNLMGTGITDSGLENLKPLTHLQYLYLSGTKVTNAGLVHLQSFPQLEKLNLPGTSISDAGLRYLAPLKNLRKLSLSSSGITDAGLSYLQPLSQLQELSLDGTAISDAGLPNLYGMKKLKLVELNSTQVTPAGIALLQQALPPEAVIHFTPPAPPLPPAPTDESPKESNKGEMENQNNP